MFSAGMRESGKRDVRVTVGQHFRAGNQRKDLRLYTLRGAGQSLGHMLQDIVHQRDSRMRFLGLRSVRAYDTR